MSKKCFLCEVNSPGGGSLEARSLPILMKYLFTLFDDYLASADKFKNSVAGSDWLFLPDIEVIKSHIAFRLFWSLLNCFFSNSDFNFLSRVSQKFRYLLYVIVSVRLLTFFLSSICILSRLCMYQSSPSVIHGFNIRHRQPIFFCTLFFWTVFIIIGIKLSVALFASVSTKKELKSLLSKWCLMAS